MAESCSMMLVSRASSAPSRSPSSPSLSLVSVSRQFLPPQSGSCAGAAGRRRRRRGLGGRVELGLEAGQLFGVGEGAEEGVLLLQQGVALRELLDLLPQDFHFLAYRKHQVALHQVHGLFNLVVYGYHAAVCSAVVIAVDAKHGLGQAEAGRRGRRRPKGVRGSAVGAGVAEERRGRRGGPRAGLPWGDLAPLIGLSLDQLCDALGQEVLLHHQSRHGWGPNGGNTKGPRVPGLFGNDGQGAAERGRAGGSPVGPDQDREASADRAGLVAGGGRGQHQLGLQGGVGTANSYYSSALRLWAERPLGMGQESGHLQPGVQGLWVSPGFGQPTHKGVRMVWLGLGVVEVPAGPAAALVGLPRAPGPASPPRKREPGHQRRGKRWGSQRGGGGRRAISGHPIVATVGPQATIPFQLRRARPWGRPAPLSARSPK
nr:PREDICTED: uncharacterized protein LOC103281854 [Anolis carolinensis]|eukprot:XP_008122351.1 PREDICTED: uncharacterized protein LOC103281854 [Anolis carolinensis]